MKERKCYPHDTKIEVYVYLLLNNFSVLSDFQVFLRAEMHILIFLAVVLFALPCAPSPCKGRTIRKVMVGGRSTKKNSCKGILSEKKIHARRVDQKKNSCIGLPYILHKFQEDRQESILCAKHQLFE